MRYFIFVLALIPLFFSSCENFKKYSSDDNSIEGEFELDYKDPDRPKREIATYDSMTVRKEYRISLGNVEAKKEFTVYFTTKDGDSKYMIVRFELRGEKDLIIHGGGNYGEDWSLKNVEDMLAFYTSEWGYLNNVIFENYSGGASTGDNSVVNKSKIIETENGPGVLLDLEIPDGVFNGTETVSNGGDYYYEYYQIKTKGFQLEIVDDLTLF